MGRQREIDHGAPSAVSVSGGQPATQSILGNTRGKFAPPMRQPREGRDPNGRRPLAGSVSDGE